MDLGIRPLSRVELHKTFLCASPDQSFAIILKALIHRFTSFTRQAFGLVLLRKEVIQPHLPVRLPCYDLVPVTNHTFADALLAVRQPTSGTTNFGDLTGGVYKTRERIHPIVADTGLLTIPASCRRVAACNLNWGRL